jgi:hypothetical protein
MQKKNQNRQYYRTSKIGIRTQIAKDMTSTAPISSRSEQSRTACTFWEEELRLSMTAETDEAGRVREGETFVQKCEEKAREIVDQRNIEYRFAC